MSITDSQQSFSPYTAFAKSYSEGGEVEFSRNMAHWILDYLKLQVLLPVQHIADVACGAGAAAVLFAEKGYRVTGTDASAQMLAHACKRASDHRLNITFHKQKMQDFALVSQVDIITCMYDSLNFIADIAALRQVFERFGNALNRNGYLFFDVYTKRGLSVDWGTKCEIHTSSEAFFIVAETKWSIESDSSTKMLHGFEKNGENWIRWSEKHQMYAHKVSDIEHCLNLAGFESVQCLDWNGGHPAAPSEETRRMLVIARKISVD